jgi:hypothetical protein
VQIQNLIVELLWPRYRIFEVFTPMSVQFKIGINDVFPGQRHQKRHLDFCTSCRLQVPHSLGTEEVAKEKKGVARKRHQMRHSCNLACLVAKQVL